MEEESGESETKLDKTSIGGTTRTLCNSVSQSWINSLRRARVHVLPSVCKHANVFSVYRKMSVKNHRTR